MSLEISRRQVLKTFVLGAAFSNVIGKSWAESLLHEITPLSHIQTGILRINLNEFPALNQPLGSVRISTSAMNASRERQLGLFAPVIINRSQTGALHVMSAACTHENCTVRRLDPNSQRMGCPCHGSQFGADGAVLQGPAGQPLLKLVNRQQGSFLEIEMQDVFFEISTKRAANSARVELSFLAFDQITYEIYHRPSLSAEPQRIAFATSPDGPLDQTELRVVDDFARAYVERPGSAGIFQIAMKTQTV